MKSHLKNVNQLESSNFIRTQIIYTSMTEAERERPQKIQNNQYNGKCAKASMKIRSILVLSLIAFLRILCISTVLYRIFLCITLCSLN
jgi:hypothetical protein